MNGICLMVFDGDITIDDGNSKMFFRFFSRVLKDLNGNIIDLHGF